MREIQARDPEGHWEEQNRMYMSRFTKLFVVLAFLCGISAMNLKADNVSSTLAYDIAQEFYNKAVVTKSKGVELELSWDSNSLVPSTFAAGDSNPAFYVFRPVDGDGFVIVSGDDKVRPILGYSFHTSMSDVDKLPANFKDWLVKCHWHIKEVAKSSVITKSSNIWADNNIGQTLALLETAQWHQTYPYSLQCPMYNGERSVAGCLPVAIAIYMHYYQWPSSGNGCTNSYTTKSYGISVSSRNLEYEYEWNKMLNTYNYSVGYTTEEANAVATLMADIGAALQADYSPYETSATIKLSALCNHFRYNHGAYLATKDNYTHAQWIDMICDELMAAHPIIYMSSSPTDGGHAYIVDGVTDNEYFHVNWGWGGHNNGYFSLMSLTPGYYDFSYDQLAVFNFYPDREEDSSPAEWLKINSPGIYANTDTFSPFISFSLGVDYICNNTQSDFIGDIRFALVDKDEQIKEWISDTRPFNLGHGYYTYVYNVNCMITEEIVVGDRIRGFYRSQSSDQWNMITKMAEDAVWEIFVSDQCSVEEGTSLEYNRSENTLVVRFKQGISASLYSDGVLVNEGVTYNYDYIVIYLDTCAKDAYNLVLTRGSETKSILLNIKPL